MIVTTHPDPGYPAWRARKGDPAHDASRKREDADQDRRVRLDKLIAEIGRASAELGEAVRLETRSRDTTPGLRFDAQTYRTMAEERRETAEQYLESAAQMLAGLGHRCAADAVAVFADRTPALPGMEEVCGA